MHDLLRKGIQWMSRKMNACASENVVYIRDGREKTVAAILGQTEYERSDDFGLKTGAFVSDFLIEFDNLGFCPRQGDRIIAGRKEYEVLEFGTEGCWRWSDPFGVRMRIHVKQIREGE